MNYLVAVDECFLDRPSGAPRVAWDIALAMRDRGHRVTLVCKDLGSTTETARMVRQAGIRILRYGVPALPRWHPSRARVHQRSVSAAIRRHLSSEKWDLVHLHSPILGLGVIEALDPRTRFLYTMHSPITLEQKIVWGSQGLIGLTKRLFGMRLLKAYESEVLSRCAAIHVLSDYSRRQMKEIHGPTDRVTILPHWGREGFRRVHSREQARQLLGWPMDASILFTIRNHAPRCGLDVAIDALAPLAARNRCIFMLGGDGALRPSLEQRARKLGANESQVRFLGYLSEEPLLLAYEAADLFILPTIALECFGLIILEAFAVGCPVLASEVAAIPELIRPVAPQLLVPAKSVAHLRQKVESFLDGTLELPASHQLMDYVQQQYGAEVIAPRMVRFLESLAAPGRSERLVAELLR